MIINLILTVFIIWSVLSTIIIYLGFKTLGGDKWQYYLGRAIEAVMATFIVVEAILIIMYIWS
jgi:hypothetical protein